MQSYTYGSLRVSDPSVDEKPAPEVDEIRLIKLNSGAYGAPLECDIVRLSLQGAQDTGYTAISYVWGVHHRYSEVKTPEGAVAVTKNLHDALQRLRALHAPLYVWADAICINQDDIEERNHQVTHMGAIYSRAQNVFIWLGQNSSGRNPFSYIERLHYFLEPKNTSFTRYEWSVTHVPSLSPGSPEMMRVHKHRLSEEKTGHATESESASTEGKQGTDEMQLDDEVMSSLAHLFSQDWFRRKWIIQEATLALKADVMFGNFLCEWKIFVDLYHDLGYHSKPGRLSKIRKLIQRTETGKVRASVAVIGLNNALLLGYLSRGSHFVSYASFRGVFKIGHLLVCTSRFECSDARDHVIAIINLIKEHDPSGTESLAPIINYKLSFEEIFVRMIRWILANEGFNILRQVATSYYECGIGDSSLDSGNLPSWSNLPPFKGRESSAGYDPIQPIAMYALGKLESEVLMRLSILKEPSFFAAGRGLRAPGRRVGTIEAENFVFRCDAGLKACTGLPPSVASSSTRSFDGKFFISDCDMSDPPPPDTLPVAVHLLEDFAWDVHGQVTLSSLEYKTHSRRKFFLLQHERLHTQRDDPSRTSNSSYCSPKARSPEARSIRVERLENLWQSYKFCLNTGRAMMLAPPNSQVGDVLAVFRGCISPFVLRPCGQGHYVLLGDAITVPSIWPGEHFDDDFVQETFEIC